MESLVCGQNWNGRKGHLLAFLEGRTCLPRKLCLWCCDFNHSSLFVCSEGICFQENGESNDAHFVDNDTAICT